MAFTIIRNDFFDYFRFFYDEVASISDFFEKTYFAMINYSELASLAQIQNDIFLGYFQTL